MRVYPAVVKMCIRLVICSPMGVVVALLCATIIGIPLGLGLGAIVGAWCTAPLRKHPLFNVNGDAE